MIITNHIKFPFSLVIGRAQLSYETSDCVNYKEFLKKSPKFKSELRNKIKPSVENGVAPYEI